MSSKKYLLLREMIRERLLRVIETARLTNPELEEKTGVKATTWGNLKTGKQRANEDHIEAICKIRPEFAYWVTTGLTIPEAGQISPELEEARQKLDQAG